MLFRIICIKKLYDFYTDLESIPEYSTDAGADALNWTIWFYSIFTGIMILMMVFNIRISNFWIAGPNITDCGAFALAIYFKVSLFKKYSNYVWYIKQEKQRIKQEEQERKQEEQKRKQEE